MDIIEKINNQIADNKILLYMKGSPDKPECGFCLLYTSDAADD